MQILKDTIKDAIVESATVEFYKHGFEKASIRRIARNAGITAGNLYHYFDGKEELFIHIAQPALEQIMGIIGGHDENMETITEADLDKLIDEGTEVFIRSFKNYRREVLILIDGSRGTRFASAREDMLEYFTSHVMEHLSEVYPPGSLKVYRPLARALAVSYLEGCFEILRSCHDDDSFEMMMKELLRIFVKGFMGMINKR